MFNPEPLFLINDYKTEFVEMDIRTDQRMRTDDNVDGAVCQPFQNAFALLAHFMTGQSFDHDRKFGKPFAEAEKMLLGKNGGRNKKCNLLSGNRTFERGTHRDFRFSVTDVTAEQTVHRARGLHVMLDLRNGLFLSFRFIIGKRIFKKFLIVAVPWERHSRRRFADRLHPQHFAGKTLCGTRRFFPRF